MKSAVRLVMTIVLLIEITVLGVGIFLLLSQDQGEKGLGLFLVLMGGIAAGAHMVVEVERWRRARRG